MSRPPDVSADKLIALVHSELDTRDAELERLRQIIKDANAAITGLSTYLSIHGFKQPIPALVALRAEAER